MASKPKTMAMELPPEIVLFHILPRIPVKSIFRFKCSSKRWYSLVTPHDTLANKQLYRQNHEKLLFIKTTTPCKFHSIDCEAPDDGLTFRRTFPFYVACHENISIITSVNGLVLVGVNAYKYEYSDLILWNPLTGEFKTLPKTNSQKECYQSMGRPLVMYYSSSEDDYKLVRVSCSRDIYMYSLKSDSWRKLELREKFNGVANYWPSCEFVDENLYFMEIDKIVRFDLKTENFTEIATPFMRKIPFMSKINDGDVYNRFTVIRGCLHVWGNNLDDSKIELWKMNGDGDWTNVVTNYFQAKYSDRTLSLKPLHAMANGNWLMYNEGYFCKVDPEKSTILTSYSFKSMDILPALKYAESFESPNLYMKHKYTGNKELVKSFDEAFKRILEKMTPTLLEKMIDPDTERILNVL